LDDHFVGVMKGVILGIAPQATIVDITHSIPPFQILQAAFEIDPWLYFPKGTIHVVIVDPGVGGERRPLLVEASGHSFIGPDNGVFSLIYRGSHKVREITNRRLALASVSNTFHGRDIFAPAAAHLASGVLPSQFGKLIQNPREVEWRPVKSARGWRGQVIKADRFGNLLTTFHLHQFPNVRTRFRALRVNGKAVRRFALTYSDGAKGELMVLIGSSGFLEIVATQASAAKLLKCKTHAPVELEFS
jgi:S-adenosylmethionine hydrolase